MTLLFETNQRHSRLLFLSCLIIALVLSPVVLRLVERSMSGLCATHSPRSIPTPRNGICVPCGT